MNPPGIFCLKVIWIKARRGVIYANSYTRDSSAVSFVSQRRQHIDCKHVAFLT